MQAFSRIYGSGFVTGEVMVPNERMAKVCDTSDEWIRERSGIQQRYFVNEGTGTSDSAVGAAKKALEDSGTKPEEIDDIVVATMTPDYDFPGRRQPRAGEARAHQHSCPRHSAAVLGVRVRPSGLRRADSFGPGEEAALHRRRDSHRLHALHEAGLGRGDGRLTAEIPQSEKDWNSKFVAAVLFGDAAGAVVMGPTDDPKRGLLGFALHSDGKNVEALYVPSAGFAYRLTSLTSTSRKAAACP